jgi:hypothetical protein
MEVPPPGYQQQPLPPPSPPSAPALGQSIEQLLFTVNLLSDNNLPLQGLLKPRKTWIPTNKTRQERQDIEAVIASTVFGSNESQNGAVKLICAEQPEPSSKKGRQGRFRWLYVGISSACDDFNS